MFLLNAVNFVVLDQSEYYLCMVVVFNVMYWHNE